VISTDMGISGDLREVHSRHQVVPSTSTEDYARSPEFSRSASTAKGCTLIPTTNESEALPPVANTRVDGGLFFKLPSNNFHVIPVRRGAIIGTLDTSEPGAALTAPALDTRS
jgi:hypothetical protein